MPLKLGDESTERPRIISFEEDNIDERKAAAKERERLLGLGYAQDYSHCVLGEIRMVPPQKQGNIGVLRILTENGDDRLIWNRDLPEEIKDAYKTFKKYVKEGYTAFVALSSGEKGHKIDDFDPLAEEIILVPGTVPG